MPVSFKTITGADLAPYIPDLARLRIQIFREYPYLYDGNEDYENTYLQTYIQSEQAMAVLAIDDATQKVIGASTGVPMAQEEPAFKQPFLQAGFNPELIFYCGESVLLPEYRGQGIYQHFFRERERYARSLKGLTHICFCGVVRPAGHPLKPADYQPLDAVWQHFGYQPRADLMTEYAWKDIDQATETDHPMMFWIKTL